MKNKLMKIISLILCVLIVTPFFACDNAGNNDEGNNPPPETPKQTYFFDNFLNEPRFLSYEKFNSLEDAKAYAKTWRQDYELYIPDIEGADSLLIEFTSCRSSTEKEKINHSVEFKIENSSPYYKIVGFTTIYKQGEYDKAKFHMEIREQDVYPEKQNYQYFYEESGNINFSVDITNQKSYAFGIKQGNQVLEYGTLMLKETATLTPQEIKALIFDNIVSIEEQNDIDVKTNFSMNNIDVTGPTVRIRRYEDISIMRKDIKELGKKYGFSCFLLKEKDSVCTSLIYIGRDCRVDFLNGLRVGITFKQEIALSVQEGMEINVVVTPIITPSSLIDFKQEGSYEYSLILGEENSNGYKFTINNEAGIIITGTITAKDKSKIDWVRIEQQILEKIILIKGE